MHSNCVCGCCWQLRWGMLWDQNKCSKEHWEMCVHDAAWLKVKLLPVSKVWPHVRAQTQ